MLSDLSPGDKLSLKGKIFELQKKLQIIDIRNKQKEEFPYKPTLFNYDLPDRDNNVLDSINKAEIIRKQKKEMLKAAVLLQSEEGCTFAPVLTSKARHAPKNDKRPVHLRLTERGKLYNESIEQLRERMGKFDDEGNRLFTPAINRDSTRSVNHSFSSAQSSSSPAVAVSAGGHTPSFNDSASSVGGQSHSRGADGASTAAADEFLYQDARDREERFRVRERELQAQIESKAAASKINSSSIVLLRRKADRDAKSAFKVLVGKGKDEACEDDYLGIDDVQSFVHSELGGSGKWSEESLSRHTNVVWALLDSQQTGRVTEKDFVAIAAPFLLHNTPAAALQEVSTSSGSGAECSAALTLAPTEDLAQLQSFLRKAASRAQSSSAPPPPKTAFAPHIYQHTYKLASRREKKERERIEQILAQQNRKDTDNNDAQSVASSVDGSVRSVAAAGDRDPSSVSPLDGDGLPPPPPPADVSRVSTKSELGLQNRTDLMYARALIKEQNLRRIAQEVAAKEMEECTFQPKIIPAMPIFPKHTCDVDTSMDGDDTNLDDSMQADLEQGSVGAGDGGGGRGRTATANRKEKIHERLYGLKDKMRASKLLEPSSRIIEEMQACTFAPQMKSSFYRKGDTSNAPAPVPPTEKSQQGVVKSIERIRKANDEKVRRAKEEDHERKREQLDQSYARSRELARQGVVPFRFVLGERVEQREITSPVKRGEPDLIVDVKLSANKTGKITIWRGDDPLELASSFARIYSLDLKARDLLVNVICQSMEQNGLLVLPAPNYDELNPQDRNTDSHFPFPPETVDQAHRYLQPDAHQAAYAHTSAAAGAEDESFSGSSVSGSQDPGDVDEEGEAEEEEEEEGEEGEDGDQSDNSVDRSLSSNSEGDEG